MNFKTISLRSGLVFGAIGMMVLAGPARAAEPSVPAEGFRFFETKVRPLLVERCYSCHGEKKHKGGLRVDSRAALLSGGDQGPAIVPGTPEKSLIIKAIAHTDSELKMPPSKKLAKEQVADLTRWVKLGAPWPGATGEIAAPVKRDKVVTEQDRKHWSFQPVRRPALPIVRNAGWVANPVDAFILAGLEAKNLGPAPPASRRDLIRRVCYDLTGLPPTPEEVTAFLADRSPNAYENLIDRLLDSPRYGEKWGRHWLDLVRFAETNSYERDNPKPNAWRYRDYVIRAFNQDKPYDRFIREQLAGDELPDAGADGQIATGFYRLGIWDDEPTDRELARYDGLDDIVTTTGQAFLGLTLDCARCHAHKLDPIPHRDYYRFLAFFQNINHFRNGGSTDEVPIITDAGARAVYEQRVQALEQRRSGLEKALHSFEEEFHKLYEQVRGRKLIGGRELAGALRSDGAALLGKERYARYSEQRKELEKLRKEKVAGELALCITENGRQAPETHVLIRGNPQVKGDRVEPGFPEVLGGPPARIPAAPPGAKTTGRRRVLADWIASKENPLTARVMVNRIWQFHFGRGIVRSPNNFGTQGDKPTHPELLDWLAAEFVQQGWRMKPLHRIILMSNAYKMSSAVASSPAVDPINDRFHRFEMRRLTAEEVRDSILAVSGVLNLKMYGPGVYVEIPKEVMAGQSIPGYGWGKSPPEDQVRRSIYIHVKRSLLEPLLEAFDIAETDRTTPVRFATTQPTQALGMLNGVFLRQQAEQLAARLRRETGTDAAKQVTRALFLATQRAPTEKEVRRGVDLMAGLQKDGASSEAALKYFCLVVLNLNEFVYLD